jgi:hypothetical protein
MGTILYFIFIQIIDVWGVGVIFANLLHQHYYFNYDNNIEVLMEIFELFGYPGPLNAPCILKYKDYKDFIKNAKRIYKKNKIDISEYA